MKLPAKLKYFCSVKIINSLKNIDMTKNLALLFALVVGLAFGQQKKLQHQTFIGGGTNLLKQKLLLTMVQLM